MSTRQELISQMVKDLDSVTTGAIRFLAARTSRRSFLGRFGVLIAGMGALPVLPMSRASAQTPFPPTGSLDAVNGVEDIEEMATRKAVTTGATVRSVVQCAAAVAARSLSALPARKQRRWRGSGHATTQPTAETT